VLSRWVVAAVVDLERWKGGRNCYSSSRHIVYFTSGGKLVIQFYLSATSYTASVIARRSTASQFAHALHKPVTEFPVLRPASLLLLSTLRSTGAGGREGEADSAKEFERFTR